MPRITNTRAAGLRKYIAQPNRYAARYGNFTLTTRDYHILSLVHQYRYLEVTHVRALIDGSDQQITRRLQGLFHNRYVRRYVPPQPMRPDLNQGPPKIAYGLEINGARALSVHGTIPTDEPGVSGDLFRWKKADTRRTVWFLEHLLMISDFRCVLELALRSTPGIELVSWEQERLRKGTVTTRGGTHIIRIAPDAHFVLRQAGEDRHFFLEVDRSTEEHDRLLRRFRNYWWYLQSPDFRNGYSRSPRVNVLFVTTGEKRMRNMMATLRRFRKPNRADHGGKGIFRFCVQRDFSIDKPTCILARIWRRGGNVQVIKCSL